MAILMFLALIPFAAVGLVMIIRAVDFAGCALIAKAVENMDKKPDPIVKPAHVPTFEEKNDAVLQSLINSYKK